MIVPISLPILIITVVVMFTIYKMVRDCDRRFGEVTDMDKRELLALINLVETKLDNFISEFDEVEEDDVTFATQDELNNLKDSTHNLYKSLARSLEREQTSFYRHESVVLRSLAVGFYSDVDLITDIVFTRDEEQPDKIEKIKLRLISTRPGILIGRKGTRFARFLEICEDQVSTPVEVEIVENRNEGDCRLHAKPSILDQVRNESGRERDQEEAWSEAAIYGEEERIDESDSFYLEQGQDSDTLELQIEQLQPIQVPVQAPIDTTPIPAIPVDLEPVDLEPVIAYPDPELNDLFDGEDEDDTAEVILLDEFGDPVDGSWDEIDRRKRGLSGFDGGC